MKGSRQHLSAALGFAVLVAAVAVSIQSTSHSQGVGKDVVVTNTAANPVPTQAVGTTSVSGSVGLAPGTTVGFNPLLNIVRVASSVAAPLFVNSVDDAARQIYHEQRNVEIPPGSFGEHEIVVVPNGKRLVIEHVSSQGIAPAGQKVSAQLLTIVNGHQVQHAIASTSSGPTGSIEFWTGSHAMRIYGDPNSTVLFDAGREQSTGTANVLISISGYFVDVP